MILLIIIFCVIYIFFNIGERAKWFEISNPTKNLCISVLTIIIMLVSSLSFRYIYSDKLYKIDNDKTYRVFKKSIDNYYYITDKNDTLHINSNAVIERNTSEYDSSYVMFDEYISDSTINEVISFFDPTFNSFKNKYRLYLVDKDK